MLASSGPSVPLLVLSSYHVRAHSLRDLDYRPNVTGTKVQTAQGPSGPSSECFLCYITIPWQHLLKARIPAAH